MGTEPHRRTGASDLWTRFERRVGARIAWQPDIVSSVKLFFVAPAFIAVLAATPYTPATRIVAIALFLMYGLLDYVDGLVARAHGRATRHGRIYDRLTDYPITFTLLWFVVDHLPLGLLLVKLGLDVLLLLLYMLRRGSTQNRLRTGLNYLTLLVLLLLTLGFGSRLIAPALAESLLWANVLFTAAIALRNLGVLQKRFIADTLSAGNLLCGIFSMSFAYFGRVDISLLFLMVGAAFDGLDGAAARRYGSTRWGVFSDDVADGVNYGVAPGVATMLILRDDGTITVEGAVIGGLFILFTISRLIFFTLNKKFSDPNYFRGVPSTVGGMIVLCAAYLFSAQTAILGFFVGLACVLMVTFDAQYRHVGRLLAERRSLLAMLTAASILLLVYGAYGDRAVPIAAILMVSLMYGFLPTFGHFYRLGGQHRDR